MKQKQVGQKKKGRSVASLLDDDIQSGRFHAVSDVILEATLVFTLPPFYLPMLI